jgi:hypothetical protein
MTKSRDSWVRDASVVSALACCLTCSCDRSSNAAQDVEGVASSSANPVASATTEAPPDPKRARALALEAKKEADELGYAVAKDKLTTALQLAAPDDRKAIQEALDVVTQRLAGAVAGRWFKTESTDAMLDTREVSLALAAENKVTHPQLNPKRPVLGLRCRKGIVEVLISVGLVVDSINSTGQYRFGEDPPSKVRLAESSDLHGFFLPKPEGWLTRFAEHSSGKVTFELPLYGMTPAAVAFRLTAANEAVAMIRSTCAAPKAR